MIDGICRLSCAERSLEKLSDNGILVFDDSTRKRYQPFFTKIKDDYKIIKVKGDKPYGQGYGETAIIRKINNKN